MLGRMKEMYDSYIKNGKILYVTICEIICDTNKISFALSYFMKI